MLIDQSHWLKLILLEYQNQLAEVENKLVTQKSVYSACFLITL